MEKILLVEDNKSISKLISLKISKDLPFEIDTAYSLKEAQLFIRKNKYFIALLDLNLPDAPNGEIVDSVLEHKIPVLVISANTNKEVRKAVLEKNIIDYINKGSIENIDYAISIIKRLYKNRQYKVLVVDDSMVFRKQIQNMMKNLFFKVFAVGHGEEALMMLKENPDIKLVLTDYAMPVMDGLELTKEIRKTHSKDILSILAISSSSDDEVSAMFLKNGASDFIKKPFSKEEFSCRINNSIEALENMDEITNHANRDYLTGLYNKSYFLKSMGKYFQKSIENEEHFVLGMLQLDNQENLKHTYNEKIKDDIIIYLSELLRDYVSLTNMVASFSRGEFCILLKDISAQEAKETLLEIHQGISRSVFITEDDIEISFSICMGVSTQVEASLQDMLDEADYLLHNAIKTGANTFLFS